MRRAGHERCHAAFPAIRCPTAPRRGATPTGRVPADTRAFVRRRPVVYGDAVSDVKRTPYREKTPVASREPKPRGPLVTRAPEPELDVGSGPRPPRPIPALRGERPAADPDAGVFSGLVAPHPASSAGEWWGQIVLTLLGLPLIASTFVLVGWLDTRRAYDELVRRGQAATRPVGIAHPAAWILGAAPIGIACVAARTGADVTALALAVPFAALLGRRSIRRRILERESFAATQRRAH